MVGRIFHKCKGVMCETVMMHLFNSYCKPILLYGVDSVCLCRKKSEFIISQLACYFLETV